MVQHKHMFLHGGIDFLLVSMIVLAGICQRNILNLFWDLFKKLYIDWAEIQICSLFWSEPFLIAVFYFHVEKV